MRLRVDDDAMKEGQHGGVVGMVLGELKAVFEVVDEILERRRANAAQKTRDKVLVAIYCQWPLENQFSPTLRAISPCTAFSQNSAPDPGWHEVDRARPSRARVEGAKGSETVDLCSMPGRPLEPLPL